MGKVNPGFLDDLEPHAVNEDEAVGFVDDGGELAAEAGAVHQPELHPLPDGDGVYLRQEFGNTGVQGLFGLRLGFRQKRLLRYVIGLPRFGPGQVADGRGACLLEPGQHLVHAG